MSKEILKELNVEKLNICEANGQVKMSLFNSNNIPSLIIGNEDILPGHRKDDGVSGIMFYNNEGDECGGLIYGSTVDEDGNVEMGMSLTFDQFKQDQVLQLSLQQSGKARQYGVSIYDRPEESIHNSLDLLQKIQSETNKEKQNEMIQQLQKNNHKRIFLGKDFDGHIKLSFFNASGKEALKVFIDEEGNPNFIINGKKISIDQLISM